LLVGNHIQTKQLLRLAVVVVALALLVVLLAFHLGIAPPAVQG
jgi:hypothetical protein